MMKKWPITRYQTHVRPLGRVNTANEIPARLWPTVVTTAKLQANRVLLYYDTVMNLRVLAVTAAFVIATLIAGDCDAAPYSGQQPSTRHLSTPSHLPEADRMAIGSLAIVAASNPANSGVVGHRKTKMSILNAAISGAYGGEQIGSILCYMLLLCALEPDLVNIATAAGAAISAAGAKGQNDFQEFQARLASSLKKAAIPPFTNDVLAWDVYSHIKDLDYTDTVVIGATVPLPENTDMILLVSLEGLVIKIEGKYAIFETTAKAALRRVSTGATVRTNRYKYIDRDTLKNWTDDDSALVANYIKFTQRYFGQEIAADFLQRVELRHVLRPVETDTVSGMSRTDWRGNASADNPTLAWELVLLGDDSYGRWTLALDEDEVEFDLQVFDGYRLVYSAANIAESSYRLGIVLEDCKSLRWSVRPNYTFNGKTRVGEWMRYHSNVDVGAGNFGTEAAEDPAYLNGFPSLKTNCGTS